MAAVAEMLDPLVNVAAVHESWRPSTVSVAVPLMLRVAAPPMVSCAAEAEPALNKAAAQRAIPLESRPRRRRRSWDLCRFIGIHLLVFDKFVFGHLL